MQLYLLYCIAILLPLLLIHGGFLPYASHHLYMLLRTLARRPTTPRVRLAQMSAHLSDGASMGTVNGSGHGVSLAELPKSANFTSHLPVDPLFPTPADSFDAPRSKLGPRMVKGALYTYVRPEGAEKPELLGVSKRAMRDIGLKEGEETTEEFKELVAGNKIMWDNETKEGIYPWAQCYGGMSDKERSGRNISG